ncbi:MAG: dihydroneopterin aldolase [Thermomonas sp.]
MTDIVFIEGLRVDALIGVYTHERVARRPLVFDLEMRFDTRIAALSDQLSDALDYHAVSMRLVEFAGDSDFQLVETLAERCAALLITEFGATGVRLKLAKPGAFEGADTVGVVIERGSWRA